MTRYSIYKGLQRPIIYRGFKGKFITWGIGSLVAGVVIGGLLGALTNMYLGAFIMLALIAAGLTITFRQQQNGLHTKTRDKGIFIHPIHLKKTYANPAKDGI